MFKAVVNRMSIIQLRTRFCSTSALTLEVSNSQKEKNFDPQNRPIPTLDPKTREELAQRKWPQGQLIPRYYHLPEKINHSISLLVGTKNGKVIKKLIKLLSFN